MGLLRSIRRLLAASDDIVAAEFRLTGDIVTFDVGWDTVETSYDLWTSILDLTSNLSEVARAQAIAWAMLVYGQVVLAIEAGSIQIPGLAAATSLAHKVDAELAPLRAQYQEAQNRLRGILDHESIRAAVDTVRTLHQAGLIVSPAYREQIAGLYNSTAELSQSVFSDSTTVRSALGLIQLATYDASRAVGQPVDLQTSKYFDAAQRLAVDIERRSRDYARNPGLFWADVDERYLAPLAAQSTAAEAERKRQLSDLTSLVNSVSGDVAAVGGRFDSYRAELSPFVSVDNLREIDRIRRSYYLEVEQPIKKLNLFWLNEFPSIQADVLDLQTVTVAQGKELTAVSEIVAAPVDLEARARDRQRDRFSAILDSTLRADGEAPKRLQEGQERLSRLLAPEAAR